MDNAQDVIQFALDNMGRTVDLVLRSVTGHLIERQGKIAGATNLPGAPAALIVTDYRVPGYEPMTPRTLVELDEIIDISLA